VSDYNRNPDFIEVINEMKQQIADLQVATRPLFFATGARPAASTMPGAIIYNTTTAKHQGSNGVTWTDLY
jgi:hypothetical protein